jgi:hypothetical protein
MTNGTEARPSCKGLQQCNGTLAARIAWAMAVFLSRFAEILVQDWIDYAAKPGHNFGVASMIIAGIDETSEVPQSLCRVRRACPRICAFDTEGPGRYAPSWCKSSIGTP